MTMLRVLAACNGCKHDCKIFSLNGAALAACPDYEPSKLGRAVTSQELPGNNPVDHISPHRR